MTDIYKRLLQLIEYKGFKNINEFALKGLGYSSSEKLNRLKKVDAKPSWDILMDITNKFEDISLNWFVSGNGNMVLSFPGVGEPGLNYAVEKNDDLLAAKNEIIEILKRENDDLRIDKELFRDLLKSKIITP